ncbi:hypothetical protein PoB_007207300 [Plakobranchus ocellatus]|uniref:Uncharacterized protein n=1 Tax=Plakobranchus ocellatus TaxID=259542 RepID=A0AAV4DMN0_9GAST|nr:hypothetical protein PoB_007207300 [Plakobranchus ocellatus]
MATWIASAYFYSQRVRKSDQGLEKHLEHLSVLGFYKGAHSTWMFMPGLVKTIPYTDIFSGKEDKKISYRCNTTELEFQTLCNS